MKFEGAKFGNLIYFRGHKKQFAQIEQTKGISLQEIQLHKVNGKKKKKKKKECHYKEVMVCISKFFIFIFLGYIDQS